MLRVVRSGVVAVIGHMTDVGWRVVNPPEEYVLEVLDEARSAGVMVEINYHHRNPQPRYVRLAIERGVKLVPSSDAHSLSEIGVLSWHESVVKPLARDQEAVNWASAWDLLRLVGNA